MIRAPVIEEEHINGLPKGVPRHWRLVDGRGIDESQAEAVVIPADTTGKAWHRAHKILRERYPLVFSEYLTMCHRGDVVQGRVVAQRTMELIPPCWILILATKTYWQQRGTMGHLREGMRWIRGWVESEGVSSLAVPYLNHNFPWREHMWALRHNLESLKELRVDLYFG